MLEDVEPSEFARWAGNALYAAAKKSGPPLVIAGAKRAKDYFRPSFRDYAYPQNRTLTNSNRMNFTNTTKAGGQRAPARVNAKNGATVKYRTPRSKDAKTLATRGWVKKTLALDSLRKEVTTKTGAVISAAPPVFFRMGKNIDLGNDQGDRDKPFINMLGFRIFGSLSKAGVFPVRMRFLIMQDKTPMRTLTEAFYSTSSDAREPGDYPVTPAPTSMGVINALRPINTDRWIVKADWVENLVPDAAALSSGVTTAVIFNRYFKINKKLTYNPGYNTETTDLLPCLYLVYYQVSDNGDVVSSTDINFQLEEYFT